MNRLHRLLLAPLTILLLLSSDSMNAQAPDDRDRPTQQGESQQRVPVTIFDVSHTTMSAIELYASNTGIIGQDVANQRGSLIWPRGSGRSYILGGGFWF